MTKYTLTIMVNGTNIDELKEDVLRIDTVKGVKTGFTLTKRIGLAVIAHVHDTLARKSMDDWADVLKEWEDELNEIKKIYGLAGAVKELQRLGSF